MSTASKAALVVAALFATPAAAANDYMAEAIILVVSKHQCGTSLDETYLGGLVIQSAMHEDVTVKQASDRIVRGAVAVSKRLHENGNLRQFCSEAAAIVRAAQ